MRPGGLSCLPAALVDKYIEAHAGKHTVWELEDGAASGGGGSSSSAVGEQVHRAVRPLPGSAAAAAGYGLHDPPYSRTTAACLCQPLLLTRRHHHAATAAAG